MWLGAVRGPRDLGAPARRELLLLVVLQACTVIVSTGACFWCHRILAPPAACAGHHGTNGALRPWQSQHRSGEWPEQAGHLGGSWGAAAEERSRAWGPVAARRCLGNALTVPLLRVSVPLSPDQG